MPEGTKSCPFCKEQIFEDAIKCRYCQSSLLATAPGASGSEKLAELVLKWVGIVPLMMALLLAIAGIYGWSSMSDVREMVKKAEQSANAMVKKAEQSANAIEGKSKIIDKLVMDRIESNIETQLNEISIESTTPRALRTRRELKELTETVGPTHSAGDAHRRGMLTSAEALFLYYDRRYDAAKKAFTRYRRQRFEVQTARRHRVPSGG